MKRSAVTTLWLCSLFAITSSVHAIERCRATKDARSGAIRISAVNVNGTPSWGESVESLANSLFGTDSCLRRGRARNCFIADPATDAANLAPANCVLFVGDESGSTCRVTVPGCTNLSELTSGISNLVNEINENEARIGTVDGKVTQSASDQSQRLSEIRTGQTSQNNSLNSISSTASSNASLLSGLNTKADSNGSKLDAVTTKVDALTSAGSARDGNISTLNSTLGTVNTRTTTINTTVSNTDTTVSSINSTVSSINGNVDTLVSNSITTDGIYLLNQTVALSGHPNMADDAGFPILIDKPGHYRLTSDLIVSTDSTPAIRLRAQNDASDAHYIIDLNGFMIKGPVTGCPGSCSASAGTHGIRNDSTAPRNITVMNGLIQGFDGDGLNLSARNMVLKDMTFLGNGDDGAQTVSEATVINCRFKNNGANGYVSSNGPVVMRNSISIGNGTRGAIFVNGNATVADSVFVENGTDGVTASSGTQGFLIRDSVVADNGGVGLVLQSRAGYKGMIINSNTGGTVTSGRELGTNVCDANTSCP